MGRGLEEEIRHCALTTSRHREPLALLGAGFLFYMILGPIGL